MKKIDSQQTSSFPKLDCVIQRQRNLMVANSLVTFAFVFGVIGAVSSLAGCTGDPAETESEAQNRAAVEKTVETWSAPQPALARDDAFAELRREIVDAIPDATFDLVDVRALEAAVTSTIDVRGTLGTELMGLRDIGAKVYLRLEVDSSHDGAGRVLAAKVRLITAYLRASRGREE